MVSRVESFVCFVCVVDCPIFVRKDATSITVRPLPNQNQIIINPHRIYILSIPSHPFFYNNSVSYRTGEVSVKERFTVRYIYFVLYYVVLCVYLMLFMYCVFYCRFFPHSRSFHFFFINSSQFNSNLTHLIYLIGR